MKKLKVLLIGGFRETKLLASSLIKNGYRVTAINENRQNCDELAEIDKLKVFYGDGSKPFVLEDAGALNADIAIALTDRDDDNLVICELCKKMFNVKKTVSLIADPKKTDFFYHMGIDSVVCAISAISGIIERQAFMDEITAFVPIAEGRVNMAQVALTENAPAIFKRVMDLSLPKEVIIACILRGDSTIIPKGDTILHLDDEVLLISTGEHEAAAIKELTGK